jgi:F-type H+-transporting ATPase subunit delta
MSDGAAAARYAEGLFEVARAEDRLEALRRELDDLVRLLQRTPELQALLARPDVGADRKMQVLQAALGSELTQALMGLVNSLVRHGRGDHLAAVSEGFGRLADEAAGVVRAEVRTVVPLTEQQRSRLTAALSRATGGQVVLSERIDPGMLAGAVVQLGDRLVDGSAAGRLARMREELRRVTARPPGAAHGAA